MCATIYNMQLESQYRRQRGLKGKGAVFMTIPMAGFVLNPHPGHVVASLDKGFTIIGGFEQAANLRGRKPSVNRKTWKMVNS